MDKDLANLISRLGDPAALVREAYDLGFKKGADLAREEIGARMRDAVQRAMGEINISNVPGSEIIYTELPAAQQAEGRVERGTVKPALLEALRGEVNGLRAQDVAAKASLKDTTTRSKLSELRQDGLVIKIGERFRLKEYAPAHEEAPFPEEEHPSSRTDRVPDLSEDDDIL